MKIKTRKFLILILIFMGLSSQIFPFEKVGTTSFQFLKVWPGARGSALSGAYSTLANNSEAVFWNPAGLAKVQGFDASVNYIDWFLDIKHYALSAAYNLGDFGTLGFQAVMADVGVIEVTSVDRLGFVNGVYNPGLTGQTFSPSSFVAGLSYATRLTDKFSFGITVKYVREDLVYEKADAIVFDGGLTFETGFRSIVIGASVRHFGPEVKFIDKTYPLPQTFNIGISTYLFSANDPLIASLGDHSLLFSYDMIQPRDYDQVHSMGMEYSFKNLVFLRGGYTFNSDQEGLSAGLGLLINHYRLDYAYSNYGTYLNSVHRITIGFEIN